MDQTCSGPKFKSKIVCINVPCFLLKFPSLLNWIHKLDKILNIKILNSTEDLKRFNVS